MKDQASLPFSPTPESLAVWLETLAPLPPASAASQLNNALKLLKDCETEPSLSYPLLINLTPLCMYLSNSLSGLALSERHRELPNKSVKIAKLGIQLLKQLAMSFCRLAESKTLNTPQSQLAIFYALQLIGYCLRSCCLLYEIPSTSLWKKSAVLYRIAVETDSLEQNQTPKVQEFKAQTTIAGALKRNLLFNLFSPTRYTSAEISDFFQLSNQHFDLLDIATDQSRDFSFYWNLEGEEPCAVKGSNKILPKGFMAIDCRRFAHALQLGTLKTALKPATQARLALQLTGYKQVFSSVILGLPSTSQLIIGFSVICNYLLEQDKLTKIKQLGDQAPSTGPSLRNMSLMPLEHEKKYYETTSLPGKMALPGKTVNLLRTGSKLFVIAEKCPVDCNAGDLTLLYKEQQLPVLAVIRRKTIHEISGSTMVLLEYIPGSYSIYSFNASSGAASYALIIGESGDKPEAILPNGKYSIENKIQLNPDKTLHLNACIEYNTHFCRFSVNLDS